jgi:beta-lactamase class A
VVKPVDLRAFSRGVAVLAFVAGLGAAACSSPNGHLGKAISAGAASPLPLAGQLAARFTADAARRLEMLVAAFPGGAGIWIADPTTSAPVYSHNAEEEVLAASLYKLAVLMEAERRVDSGDLHYQDTIAIGPLDVTDEGSVYEVGAVVGLDDALETMITVSDNGTALALWRLFGGESIDAALARAGIADFHVTLDPAGDNITTPHAIGTFFTQLARNELVSASASARMQARLERQTIKDRLPAALPDSAVVAHKTGNLVGLAHDAGIIFTAHGPLVVVVMTWDADDATANAFIADVGALVYRVAEGAPLR